MSYKCYYQHTQGLTLVELLIAMALSLVLLGSASTLFLANKTTHRLNAAIAELQENARFAATLISKDIRMAGFQGCASRDPQHLLVNHVANPPETFSPTHGIEGWETATLNTSPGHYTLVQNSPVSDASITGWKSSLTNTPHLDASSFAVAQTDIVRIWRTTGDPVSGNRYDSTFQAHSSTPYAARDLILLTDCQGAELALVCSLSGKTADFACVDNQVFSTPDPASGLQAFQYTGVLYYVGKRSKVARNPPALYRRIISKNALAETAQEVVEGIESLQIVYGEDTAEPHGEANQYVPADEVANWKNVVSVNIELLTRSTEPVLSADEPQPILYNGANLTANDGYLRYPFHFSVALRNRLP